MCLGAVFLTDPTCFSDAIKVSKPQRGKPTSCGFRCDGGTVCTFTKKQNLNKDNCHVNLSAETNTLYFGRLYAVWFI